jgi:ribosome-associated protein
VINTSLGPVLADARYRSIIWFSCGRPRPIASVGRRRHNRSASAADHQGADTIALIPVTARIALNEDELHETFMRSSGAGGQNIQKVETAVQLRFDARRSPNLPDPVRARLEQLAGQRLTNDGVIVITAQRHRTRERNRVDAQERLFALIREAALPPPPKRRPTRPTRGSKERRLEGKSQRSDTKRMRGRPDGD